MNEQEITQTHFSENWAVEQVARHVRTGLAGWAAVPHILRPLPEPHRHSARNALRIARTLLLIEMQDSRWGDPFTREELEMCPVEGGNFLAWARVKVP